MSETMHSGRRFGCSGREVPIIGQGTWQMERDDRARAVGALRAGVEAGMVHIDTAEMYGNGAVEEIVGEAIAPLRRDELFVVSKVMPHNASYAGTLAACQASLSRLGSDYLDVYLLHWRGAHPLAETFRAFEQLMQQGMIRSYGVSNFDVADLIEAHALVGDGKIVCNQVLYYLEERYVEGGLGAWCAEHDIAVVGYSPFGSGSFTEPDSAGGRVLAEVADARGATARQVALAFLARANTFVIPKASRRAHVLENAAAGAITLSDDEIATLDAAFSVRARDGLPMI